MSDQHFHKNTIRHRKIANGISTQEIQKNQKMTQKSKFSNFKKITINPVCYRDQSNLTKLHHVTKSVTFSFCYGLSH